MKTRNGFVSNSSSSSFIVGFDSDPKVLDNLIKEMGDCETDHGWGDDICRELCKEEVISRVHEDILKSKSAEEDNWKEFNEYVKVWLNPNLFDLYHSDDEKIIAEIKKIANPKYQFYHYIFDEASQLMIEDADYEEYLVKAKENFNKKDEEWIFTKDQYEKLRDLLRKEYFEMDDKLYSIKKKPFIYILTYADEDGDAAMEHGNIFRNTKHIEINMH